MYVCLSLIGVTVCPRTEICSFLTDPSIYYMIRFGPTVNLRYCKAEI